MMSTIMRVVTVGAECDMAGEPAALPPRKNVDASILHTGMRGPRSPTPLPLDSPRKP